MFYVNSIFDIESAIDKYSAIRLLSFSFFNLFSITYHFPNLEFIIIYI